MVPDPAWCTDIISILSKNVIRDACSTADIKSCLYMALLELFETAPYVLIESLVKIIIADVFQVFSESKIVKPFVYTGGLGWVWLLMVLWG